MKARTIFALIIILGLLATPTSGLASSAVPECNGGIDSPPTCCYCIRNGWGEGTRYVHQGSWATYTAYNGVAESVTLWSQDENAGTVSFSDPVDGMVTITITLNNRWYFNMHGPGKLVESVHIQDYMDPPPPVIPVPGQFAYKYFAWGHQPFTTTLPLANFYGVNVYLSHSIPCPPSTTTGVN